MLDSSSHHPPGQGLPPCESHPDSRYRERISYTPPEFVLCSKYKRNLARMTVRTACGSGRLNSEDIDFRSSEINRPLPQAVLTLPDTVYRITISYLSPPFASLRRKEL